MTFLCSLFVFISQIKGLGSHVYFRDTLHPAVLHAREIRLDDETGLEFGAPEVG